MPDCNSIDLMKMSNCLNLRQDLLNRIANVLNDSSYREAMENSSLYNNRLVGERQMRLPFLDAQTGVAQSDCYLWMNRWERMPGKYEGQLYSYPSRKWRKKRRQYLMNETYLTTRKTREFEISDNDGSSSTNNANSSSNNNNNTSNNNSNNVSNSNNTNNSSNNNNGSSTGNNQHSHSHQTSGLTGTNSAGLNDSSIKLETGENSNDKYFDMSKEGWYQEFDDGSDLPDAGELDDPESDYDDYEEYSSRKKRKKRESQKRKRVEYNDSEKPFSCDLCGARYKTRPGLSYHYSHTHQSDNENRGNRGTAGGLEDEDMPYTPPRQVIPPPNQAPPSQQVHPATSASTTASIPLQSAQQMSNTQTTNAINAVARATAIIDEQGEVPRASSGKPSISNYCDFCLGNSVENKKTKSAEELVSCSDCGRSAHPTCLQFTPNMTNSVKKYRWQCIECKSCGLCGTSDNDDQLLFCDDCDRGYHMYCLRPPLSEPPEGSWSCHLCIEEYHTPKK